MYTKYEVIYTIGQQSCIFCDVYTEDMMYLLLKHCFRCCAWQMQKLIYHPSALANTPLATLHTLMTVASSSAVWTYTALYRCALVARTMTLLLAFVTLLTRLTVTSRAIPLATTSAETGTRREEKGKVNLIAAVKGSLEKSTALTMVILDLTAIDTAQTKSKITTTISLLKVLVETSSM